MAMNLKNPAIKRILRDVRDIENHRTSRFTASPLEDNMFEWHFTIRGPKGTDFEGGIYHGRILLPNDYPFKPPNIVFLTKNGRFEMGTKICLSISAHHPEAWKPAWGIRTMLEAIISFLPTEGQGAIGALDWTPAERQQLAQESLNYRCTHCGCCKDLLMDEAEDEEGGLSMDQATQDQIAQLHLHSKAETPSSTRSNSIVSPEPSRSNSIIDEPNTPERERESLASEGVPRPVLPSPSSPSPNRLAFFSEPHAHAQDVSTPSVSLSAYSSPPSVDPRASASSSSSSSSSPAAARTPASPDVHADLSRSLSQGTATTTPVASRNEHRHGSDNPRSAADPTRDGHTRADEVSVLAAASGDSGGSVPRKRDTVDNLLLGLMLSICGSIYWILKTRF